VPAWLRLDAFSPVEAEGFVQLISHFERAAHLHPDRLAFVQPDGEGISYASAAQTVHALASALRAAGVMEGARVAILCPNDSVGLLAMLGAIRAGLIWISLNPRNTVEDNLTLVETAGASVLLFHKMFTAEAERIRGGLSGSPLCMELYYLAGGGRPSGAKFRSAGEYGLPALSYDMDRPCAIFATGGTTGRSKGAVWTNRTWETLIANFWTCAPQTDHPIHLCVAPITHGAGALALILLPRGVTNVLMTSTDPGAILAAIERHRVTHLFLPPTVLYALLSSPLLGKHDTSSLIFFLISAAPVGADKLREAVGAFGPVMCQAFGQAEAPFLLTYLSSADLVRALTSEADAHILRSCGRATMFAEVEIMDDCGHILGPGQAGEIVARSGLVMAGYYADETATSAVSEFGWHHTGDIGIKDGAGFVFIVDRKRDIIISGGFNIYSTEVENVLLAHSEVQDCAVIGVPDDKWGEAVKALVECKAGASVMPEDLLAYCKEKLGSVKCPKTIEIWERLPRSPVGKVLKRTIRERYWVGRERQV